MGAGAVGGTLGVRLHESGVPVELVARGKHAEAIKDNGLTLLTPEGRTTAFIFCRTEVSKIVWRAGDVAICAVKSHHAEKVLENLATHAGSEIPLVCASNGIHCELWAKKYFDTVISMMVWTPATHLEPGVVRVFATGCLGVMDVGPVKGDGAANVARQLRTLLQNAGFSSEYRDDIQSWKYAKWVCNLGNTAQALISDNWRPIASLARAEGETVLGEADVTRIATEVLLKRCELVKEVPIEGEARGGGSTWQSHIKGRALETPYLEGAMAVLAARVGVPAPVNQLLAELAEDRFPLTAAEFMELLESREA